MDSRTAVKESKGRYSPLSSRAGISVSTMGGEEAERLEVW